MEQFKSDIKYVLTTDKNILNTLLKYKHIDTHILNTELIKICNKYIKENKYYLDLVKIDTPQTRTLQQTLIIDIIKNKDISTNIYNISYCDETETFLSNKRVNRLICKTLSYLKV